MNLSQLYNKDFYQWTVETGKLLKAKQFSELDIAHLCEEIENMGASEIRELENRFEVLIMHLLKWQFQPHMQTRSWRLTIEEQRRKLKRHLAKTPSLKSQVDSVLVDIYPDAVIAAAKETSLPRSTFPNILPYTFEQLLDDQYYPEAQCK